MERNAMILEIKEAAKTQSFSSQLDEVETLTYFYPDESGEISEWEDRFDYIDLKGMIWFICGTGSDEAAISISPEDLTDMSVEKIYSYILK